MYNKIIKITIPAILITLFISNILAPQPVTHPPYIATDIKTERVKFTGDSIKLTWKMDSRYPGDFIVGKSEKEISNVEDVLQAKLIGIYNSSLEGSLIDRDFQQGKKYYYIILAKEYLLKRDIDIIKNVNYTAEAVTPHSEPEPVKAIRVDVSDDNKILIQWTKSSGSSIKYNIYRSRSAISSTEELEVAEKITVTEKSEYTDNTVADYGSYFYAVTVTDKNGIEYFTPKIDQNYTSNGIFLKGKALTTPLNVTAFIGEKNEIVIKWEKAESLTGKDLQGYEIYRHDEQINSLLKLRSSKLIQIADNKTTVYTDRDLNPGKYYYAVFSRYSDGAVDINFDTDTNYTKTPLLIIIPYRITSLNYETVDSRIILNWNYAGNTGIETVSIFRTSVPPADSSSLTNNDIIGTENIRTGKFTINRPADGIFYYGVLSRQASEIVQISKGINITASPIGESGSAIKPDTGEKTEKKDEKNNQEKTEISPPDNSLDEIVRNTYYKGNYSKALKELRKYITSTDNKYYQSKARLFMAKSYIELQEYEKSIMILNSDELKNAFPEETKFWFEYALVRLK